MRDAIVYGYDWNGGSGPVERIALALARAGAKVLHCGSAASVFKKPDTSLRQVEPNVFTFKPQVFVSRLNRFPAMARWQGAAVAHQILERAGSLRLVNPSFVYGRLGSLVLPLLAAMKAHGSTLVHLYTDSIQSQEEIYVGGSDLSLIFSRTAFHRLRARWGDKVRYGFFGVDLVPFLNLRHDPDAAPPVLAKIPRPRLGYGGAYGDEFLNTRVLGELLERRPEWNFVSFGSPRLPASGSKPAAPLANAHLLPWQSPEGFARCVAAFDIGFMPYDCSDLVLLNTAPMKVWDYFALGMPVVSTPLIQLWEYEGLVRFGDTAKELERAVEEALAEPLDSPLREQRKAEAKKHSNEALGRLLEQILA